jgi:hypothetical protein
MRRAAFALLALTCATPVLAQTDDRLAQRCTELGALYDRYNGRRGEGSGGPNLDRLGAGLDCQKGRYDKGIKTLEDLLRRNRIDFPPG